MINSLRINPLVLDQLEFYRVEYIMDNFKEYNEKKNQRQQEQEKGQKSSMDTSSMMRSSQNSFKQYLSGNKLKL